MTPECYSCYNAVLTQGNVVVSQHGALQWPHGVMQCVGEQREFIDKIRKTVSFQSAKHKTMCQ